MRLTLTGGLRLLGHSDVNKRLSLEHIERITSIASFPSGLMLDPFTTNGQKS